MPTLVIGIKKKPGMKPSMPPPEMPGKPKGRIPRSPKPAMPQVDAEPDADDQDQKATPEEVGYHDGAERCQDCKYMGDQGDCQRWGFSVQPEGWCHAFASGGAQSNESQGSDDDPDGIY